MATWANLGRCLAVGSIIVNAIAITLPVTVLEWKNVFIGLAIGLSGASTYIANQEINTANKANSK